MSGDADYEIKARIVAEDATGGGADAAERRLRRVEDQAARTSSSIMGSLGQAFAFLGGAYGIGRVVTGMVGLNAEVQTATNGMATLFSALTGQDITKSLGIARNELKALQRDAAAGVGELSDYTQAYQMLLSPALGAGKSTDQIRELVRNGLAAGAALRGNEGLRLAPLDLAQALQGQVGDRTTPIVAQALRAAGISIEKFRKEGVDRQFDDLNRAFQKFAPGVALMGQSWDSQFSTLKDTIKQIVRDVSSPLFGVWTKELIRVNQWMEANRDTLHSIATEWGGRLVRVWDTLIQRAGTYAAILAAAKVVPMVTAGRGGAVADAASGAWSAISGGWSWGASLPGRGGLLGRLAGGAAGAAGEVSAGALAPLGAALTALAWPAAAVGAAFLSIKGALTEFPDLLDGVRGGFADLVESFGQFGDALGSLTDSGSILNLIGGGLVWALGELLHVAADGVRVLAVATDAVGAFFGLVGESVRDLWAMAHGDFSALSRQVPLAHAWDTFVGNADRDWNRKTGFTYRETTDDKGDLGGLNHATHVTNIGTVNMQVRTEVNADPDRVMAALREGMDRLRRNPVQSRRVPALGV